MTRSDLLALTADDLAAWTNRGTLKRAQKELEAGEPAWTVEEEDGEVVVKWGDGVVCTVGKGKVVQEAQCTCAAVGMCRHVVRSVLAYQWQAEKGEEKEQRRHEPWNPGEIRDESLAECFKPTALTKIRNQFQQGLLVELVRSVKPMVRFLSDAYTLRFLVPGDPRYTHCDCAESAPCAHVPLAVWAFRLLPTEKQAGILSTQQRATPPPVELLQTPEAALRECAEFGVANLPRVWCDKLLRCELQCREEGLIWPAEILAELVQQHERYTARDAGFHPPRVAELIGELLIRNDAIASDTGAVPQLFLRGSRSDRLTEIRSARYIGLGCGVEQGRRSVQLTAYVQDAATGSLAAVVREFHHKADEVPLPFWQLAQTPLAVGMSLANLAAGQMLIPGGKRSPSQQLVLGRKKLSLHPQAFAWEQLRPPVLAEDFAELRARLAELPPASLRPRRVTEDFHVLSVAHVQSARFHQAAHAVEALLTDHQQETAYLWHPYTSRGSQGAESLLALLTARGADVKFVAGKVKLTSGGVMIRPVAVVYEEATGRKMLQPWVERDAQLSVSTEHLPATSTGEPDAYPQQLLDALGELFLLGLNRADAHTARTWSELARQGQALGYVRLAAQVQLLSAELESRSTHLRWSPTSASHHALQLAAWTRLAHDLAW